MMGVNIDNLENLIKKNNSCLNSFKTNSKRLIDNISTLNSCYNGNDIDYLFRGPLDEVCNISAIANIIDSYTTTLYSVKCSYQSQDLNMKTQINHMNSSL